MKNSLFSLSALAIELRCDRRSLRAALRDVPGDGVQNGHPVWKKQTAIDALEAVRASEFSATKTKLTKVKADIAELELARMRADSIPRPQVRALYRRLTTRVRSAFKPVAKRIAVRIRPGMSTGEKEAVLRDEIDRVMTMLSNLKKA